MQNNFYNIADWGVFVFVVPLVFSLYKVTSKDGDSDNKILSIIALGSLLSISLTTDFKGSFYLQKALAILLSSLIVFAINKHTKLW
ncbi:hypothetical protein BN938_2616 [Mucinivorans hirudinis]|uniref:Uncharacterized protein n=1 Tax=Mucinivorans hirudinis TaxID=1433126 RepID=A0A060RAL7_9BACT|nr:hypothetical protein BN938_2616 [Mucinivorans hirudinis]